MYMCIDIYILCCYITRREIKNRCSSSDPRIKEEEFHRLFLFSKIFHFESFWKWKRLITILPIFFFLQISKIFYSPLFSSFVSNEISHLYRFLSRNFVDPKISDLISFYERRIDESELLSRFFLVFVRLNVSVEIDKKILLIGTSSWDNQVKGGMTW